MRTPLTATLLTLASLACACTPPPRAPASPEAQDPAQDVPLAQDARAPDPSIDLSVAPGETGTAVVWVRTDPYAYVVVAARSDDGGRVVRGFGYAEGLGTARILLTGLRSGQHYTVTARAGGESARARFAIAPEPSAAVALRFLVGADLGGQNICRDERRGYPLFDAIGNVDAAFFLALGDMIYADATCEPVGALGNPQVPGPPLAQAGVRSFAEHWRYNLADPGLRRLRARMGWLAVWDDHEVVNDFGPATAHPPGEPRRRLLEPGLRAFVEFNPVLPPPHDPTRLYRSLRWGRQAELFVLDTRQYRDANAAPDTGTTPKSLLGQTQRDWLIDGLRRSDATWKFVVSSVPIVIPTGWPAENGRDGWASGDGDGGFERELRQIFEAAAEGGVRNLLFLSADVHFATGFALRPLPEHPEFVVHELLVGPLSAGIYPDDAMDPTFRPQRLFRHAPPAPPQSLDEALAWFNVGLIDIAADGALRFEVRDGLGGVAARLALTPSP